MLIILNFKFCREAKFYYSLSKSFCLMVIPDGVTGGGDRGGAQFNVAATLFAYCVAVAEGMQCGCGDACEHNG